MDKHDSDTACQIAGEAQGFNSEGDFEAALAACEAALSIAPGLSSARFEKSYALFLLGRLTEAAAEIALLCAQDSAYPNALWLRAGILRNLRGDYADEVIAAYRQVLQDDPCNLYALSEYADMLRSRGQYAEARAIYERLQSSALCPDEALRIEAAFQAGVVAQVLGDIPASKAAFQSVVDVAPDYPDAQMMLDLVSTLPTASSAPSPPDTD